MNRNIFESAIGEIYAIFGRNMPEKRRLEIIYKQIQSLPDAFMEYAIKHFEKQESLPQNMGRYLLRELWPKYLDRNPDLKTQDNNYSACSKCLAEMPGIRRIYRQEKVGWGKVVWKPVLARCTCGAAPNPRNERVYTDLELENMGYVFELPYDPGFEEFKKKFLERNAGEDKKADVSPANSNNSASERQGESEIPF